jgi:hypothetical protein
MSDVDPNREAELAHELEELKLQIDTQVKALHMLRSRMAVIMLRLATIRMRSNDKNDIALESLSKIAALEVEIAEQWHILDGTPVSERLVHHSVRNKIQTLVGRVYMIKRGLGDPNDKTSTDQKK